MNKKKKNIYIYIYIYISEHLNKFHKYSRYYDIKILKTDFAEIYSIHYGHVIFEQKPQKTGWF